MENETRAPTERTIVLTVDKWHCSESWLRTGEGSMFDNKGDDFLAELAAKYQLDSLEQSMIRTVYEMTSEQRKAILAFARRLVADYDTATSETDEERTIRIVREGRAAREAEADHDADKRA